MLQILINLTLIIILTSCSCNKKKAQYDTSSNFLHDISHEFNKELDIIDIPNFDFDEPEFTFYDSGLKTQIMHQGPNDTESPNNDQTVVIHYLCLQDNHGQSGDLLFNSYEHGLPIELRLNDQKTSLGLREGLLHMRIGDKHRLYLPKELTFSKEERRQSNLINTDLIYEIELLAIK